MKQTLTVQNGTLEKGLDAIETYLGQPEGTTAFINEYYSSPLSFPDLAEPADWVSGDISACLAPVVMAGEKSTLLTLSCPTSLIEYMAREKLTPDTVNILSVCPSDIIPPRDYPEGTVIRFLQKNIGNFSSLLEGKTLIPSFSSPEAQNCATTLNGRTLVSPQQSIMFNSKSFLRELSQEAEFQMPPGVILSAEGDMDKGLESFAQQGQLLGLKTSTAWLKLPTVAGGGTNYLRTPPSRSVIEKIVIDFINDANGGYSPSPLKNPVTSYDGIPQSMRRDLVLEFDLAANNNLKIAGNYCIQAVIGENAITYIGATTQATEDGDYIGGKTLNQQDQDNVEAIFPEVLKVYKAFQERGYRGYIGVDALAVQNGNQVQGYILEANCRLNASTPLLGITQKLSAQTGQAMSGVMRSLPIPVNDGTPEQVAQSVLTFFNRAGLLYKENKGEGVIPFMPDIYGGRSNPNISNTRFAIVGRSDTRIETLNRQVKRLIPAA